jgi:hypothetical protein
MSGIILLLLIVPILRHSFFDRFISLLCVVLCCHRISESVWSSSHAGETGGVFVLSRWSAWCRPCRSSRFPRYTWTAAMIPWVFDAALALSWVESAAPNRTPTCDSSYLWSNVSDEDEESCRVVPLRGPRGARLRTQRVAFDASSDNRRLDRRSFLRDRRGRRTECTAEMVFTFDWLWAAATNSQ